PAQGGSSESDPPPYESPPGTGGSGEHPTAEPEVIDGWRLDRLLSTPGNGRGQFAATRVADGRSGVLTLYACGSEPDPSVYTLLQRLPRDHIPELMATGRWNDRVYDVSEHMEHGSLADMPRSGTDLQVVRNLALELGTALRNFAEAGLRHRDLRPGNIH